MAQLVFFMTRPDLTAVVQTIETAERLLYVQFGRFAKGGTAPRFTSGLELPNLGQATGNASVSCDKYLVVLPDSEVRPHFAVDNGFIDQSMNAASVTFTPGGVHASGMMLFGRVATVHDDPIARRLMNVFRRSLQQHCKKINAFYVGAEAEKRWREGTRLTVGVDASPEFDLSSS